MSKEFQKLRQAFIDFANKVETVRANLLYEEGVSVDDNADLLFDAISEIRPILREAARVKTQDFAEGVEVERLRSLWWSMWLKMWGEIGFRIFAENGEHEGCPDDCFVCEANIRHWAQHFHMQNPKLII